MLIFGYYSVQLQYLLFPCQFSLYAGNNERGGAITRGFVRPHFPCPAPFSMPLILAPSPPPCPAPPCREGPHLLLYFSPVSNYSLTLVIYITPSVPKRAGSAGAARQVASAAHRVLRRCQHPLQHPQTPRRPGTRHPRAARGRARGARRKLETVPLDVPHARPPPRP